MPKTLHLTLTYHWWDKIASGEKKAEYRRFTANWRKRKELAAFDNSTSDKVHWNFDNIAADFDLSELPDFWESLTGKQARLLEA